ncbi:MAG: retron St85 family RNA-directed DNA polymerase [Phenylobacterium sp.]|nr:retron St85 family RNA-directed DNA polymerase [Phenylobacterium sp.]
MSRLLDDIANYLEVGADDVRRFIFAAPARYKVFSIPKRRGGARIIAQPSAALKVIQRFVIDSQLSVFPVHEAAAAYVTGKSIGHNATRHINNSYILKLDFENFFNSILVKDWRKTVRLTPDHGLDIHDLIYLDRILFWGDGGYLPEKLSVGAPSSPALSNMVMYRFDAALSQKVRDMGAVYTRYADDITISAPHADVCLELERVAASVLRTQRYSNLSFKADKRGLYGPGQRRMVTGLIVTPERRVSIGRERKRHISAMVHRASLGQLDAVRMLELKGLLGFVKGTEPRFMTSLETKYGAEVVRRIVRHEPQG